MKKFKIISALLLAASFVCISALTTSAKTVYEVNGYSYSIINNDSIELCGWDNTNGELVVPDSILGRHVTAIADNGFSGDEAITSLDFSQATKLEKIRYLAFYNCTGISNDLIIPSTVKTIGFSAFQNCSLLPSVTINGNVGTIQSEAFRGCSSLQTVSINGNTTSIEMLAFADCISLESVTIPDSVTSISGSAFNNCPNLILGVNYGSYAYQYAVDNEISYVLLDEVLLGDVDGNGYVDIRDVTEIQKCLAELREPLDELALMAGDVNGDGNVDISDATSIQLFLAELDFTYPIGQIIS